MKIEGLNVSLANARNQTEQLRENMRKEQINNLSRENANLTNQVAEKESRINGRDELAQLSIKSSDSSAKPSHQLKMQLQAAEDTSSQTKMETQRLREKLGSPIET